MRNLLQKWAKRLVFKIQILPNNFLEEGHVCNLFYCIWVYIYLHSVVFLYLLWSYLLYIFVK